MAPGSICPVLLCLNTLTSGRIRVILKLLQGSAQCTAEPTKTRIGSQVPFGEHARRLSTIAGSLKEAERGTHLVTSGFLQQVAALEAPLTRLSPLGFTVQLFSHSAFEIFGARFSFAVFAGVAIWMVTQLAGFWPIP